ncbi:ABC transporter substrate-binding protein [Mycobacterium sp. NPDC003449]
MIALDRRGLFRLGGAAGLMMAGGAAIAGCAEKPGGAGGAGGSTPVTTVRSTNVSWLWAPYLYAAEKGYFGEEGVDERGNASGDGEPAGIVASGQSEFLIGAPAGPLKSTLAGQPLTLFAGLVTTYASNIVITDEAASKAGLTPGSGNDEKAAALRGLRIATTGPGAGPDLLVRYVATEIGGLNPDRDLNLVPVQGGEGPILAAVQNNAVDGFCLSSPASDTGIARFGMQYLFDMSTDPIDELVDNLYIALSARPQTFEERPQEVTGYCRALQRSLVSIKDDPEDFKAVMKGLFEGIEPEIFELGFAANAGIYGSSIEITEPQFDQAVDFLRLALEAQGSSSGAADQLSFGDVVNTEFAKKAVTEIGAA